MAHIRSCTVALTCILLGQVGWGSAQSRPADPAARGQKSPAKPRFTPEEEKENTTRRKALEVFLGDWEETTYQIDANGARKKGATFRYTCAPMENGAPFIKCALDGPHINLFSYDAVTKRYLHASISNSGYIGVTPMQYEGGKWMFEFREPQFIRVSMTPAPEGFNVQVQAGGAKARTIEEHVARRIKK